MSDHSITETLRERYGKTDEDGVEMITMSLGALDHLLDTTIKATVPVAIETAAEYHEALRDFEAADPTETDSYPVDPDTIRDEANKGRANANPRYIHDGGLDALSRINGGYPLSPELVGAAVTELRSEGRESEARQLIEKHPGLYAVAEAGAGEDHSDLSPESIRQNALNEVDDTEGWKEGDPFEDLAPSHPWLDTTEWDVKRDDSDDLDDD